MQGDNNQSVSSEIKEIPLVEEILYETLDESLTGETLDESLADERLDESLTGDEFDESLADERLDESLTGDEFDESLAGERFHETLDTGDSDETCNPYDKVAVRRVALYSENGEDSICLASYTDLDGNKRFMLNDIDIPLIDFKNYFNSLIERKDTHDEDLLYLSIDATFITGLVILLVALSITLINISV